MKGEKMELDDKTIRHLREIISDLEQIVEDNEDCEDAIIEIEEALDHLKNLV